MSRALIHLAGLVLVGAWLSACAKPPETPAAQMEAADEAVRARDFETALTLYDGLIDWKGEGQVSAGERFKASLESVKCLIALGRAQEGVDRYQQMFGQYGELTGPDAHKPTLAVLQTLVQQKAHPDISIAFVELAQEKHPDKKENFGGLVEKIKQAGLNVEQLEKLRKLGYLSISTKPDTSRQTEEAP